MSSTSPAARGFPVFAAVKSTGRRFARSWWGQAWITSLEESALDQDQLIHARRYARNGYVGSITVSPGGISAPVHDGDLDDPYAASISVGTYDDEQWNRMVQRLVTAGHLAALMDSDLPRDLAEDTADAGVSLLPVLGEMEPDCTCDEPEHPCRHAGALAYQFAWLLDREPFLLTLLRGRERDQLLAQLQLINSGQTTEVTGTPAAIAYQAPSVPLPEQTPAQAPPHRHPAVAAAIDSAPPHPDFDVSALALLIQDAGRRAQSLLTGVEPPGCETQAAVEAWQDAVRLAVAFPDHPFLARLSKAAGRTDEQLRLAASAWGAGGPEGLRVLEEPWTPPASADRLVRSTLEHRYPEGITAAASLRTWRNRWTFEETGGQLRYGQDGRWYPFQLQDEQWGPSGPPTRVLEAALADVLDD